MKTDIEIAESIKLQPIENIAARIGIKKNQLFCYGNYMAKVDATPQKTNSKLILVTAINPTNAGEGKTTVAIGLGDALNRLNYKTALALREPSLGPVFGMKGGATGGGYAQVAPMAEINLHFTGDMHAISAANNLLASMIDNHMYWGKEPKIAEVAFNRCMDLNDRALRNVEVGIGYNRRFDHFNITAASEVMAILTLATDLKDLQIRLGNIIVGYTEDGKALTAKDIKAEGAMAILLKDAIKPNLVQTLEGTPAFIHGGPFANIAHGCNSIIATTTAASFADYVVTEAGFGADLGAEKFIDIKCRAAEIAPDVAVIVATIRALKAIGEGNLMVGLDNLAKHIQNMKGVFGVPCVVALNQFADDSPQDIKTLSDSCNGWGVGFECATIFTEGGKGGESLAKAVVAACGKTNLSYAYALNVSLADKITAIATKIYGAKDVAFTDTAAAKLKQLDVEPYTQFPVCIAKTPYSLSDNALALGRPTDFTMTVKDIQIRAGAGFFVAIAGDMLLMPGLGKTPNAENMRLVGETIEGLF